ncbi:MAG: carboxypeptidase-like regulatory domain-containing protein, partial [Flavobacteriaceae bacterium]
MRQLLIAILLIIGGTQLSAQGMKEKVIKGTVSHLGTRLVNAEVSSVENDALVRTDTEGNYQIKAVPGDLISFSYPGMRTMEIVVEDVTSILNIKMNADVNQLEEVVVEKTAIKSQRQLQAEYATNKNLINTAFGILDKEISNFSVQILDTKEIPLGGIDFISALQYRVPGIRVERFPATFFNPTVYLRGSSVGFFPAIYDVDGLILEETPTFIPIENIDRIAVLSGLGLVTKYGGRANGGVIVINTKGANYFSKAGADKPFDQARLRNNVFSGNTLSAKGSERNKPVYLQKLNASSTEQEAINLYREQ